MPFGMGIGELVVVLAIFLLVFGAKRLPEIGGALGKGIREFKSSVRDIESEFKTGAEDNRREVDRTRSRPAVPPPSDSPERTESRERTEAAPRDSEPRA